MARPQRGDAATSTGRTITFSRTWHYPHRRQSTPGSGRPPGIECRGPPAFVAVSGVRADMQTSPFAIAIHGGAGTITRAALTRELEADYRAALASALLAGQRVLAAGGPSLDAVAAAVRMLEDSPLFNAGRGSVFTHDGRIEMDASIMDGRDRRAGAVAASGDRQEPDRRGAGGDGAVAARPARRRGRRGVRARAGARDRRSGVLPHGAALGAAARGAGARPAAARSRCPGCGSGGQSRDRAGRREVRHRRGGRAGPRRQSRRGDVDRRPHQQAVRPGRRFAADRRRNLGRERERRGVGHGKRRDVHPRRRGVRRRRAGEVPQPGAAARPPRRCWPRWRRSAAAAGSSSSIAPASPCSRSRPRACTAAAPGAMRRPRSRSTAEAAGPPAGSRLRYARCRPPVRGRDGLRRRLRCASCRPLARHRSRCASPWNGS